MTRLWTKWFSLEFVHFCLVIAVDTVFCNSNLIMLYHQVGMRAGIEMDDARLELVWDMCRWDYYRSTYQSDWSKTRQYMSFHFPLHLFFSKSSVNTLIRYERAWDPSKNSPWCPLFSQEDHDLMNFRFFYR